MACPTCETTCYLIDDDCLCRFTRLKNFTLSELTDIVEDVNVSLAEITGTCDLCADFGAVAYLYTDLIDTVEFKRYYANLIYTEWLKEHADGQVSKSGYTKKGGDEFSEFTYVKKGELNLKVKNREEKLKLYEKKFLEKLEELHSTCIDCADGNCTCNCTSSSNCNCGCSCTTHIRNKDLDNYNFERLGYVPCDNSDEDFTFI